jgi:hypothetical protein
LGISHIWTTDGDETVPSEVPDILLERFQLFVRVLTGLDQDIIYRSLFKVVIILFFEEKNHLVDTGKLLLCLVIRKGDLAFNGSFI